MGSKEEGLTPCSYPSVAALNSYQIIIFGGEVLRNNDTCQKLSTEYILDTKTGLTTKIGTYPGREIAPVYYPCHRLQDNLVVTADYRTGKIFTINTAAQDDLEERV